MVRTMRPIILFLPLAAALYGQQTAATQQTEKKGSISGVVVNALTKEPVRRAEVSTQMMGGGRGMGPQGMVGGIPGQLSPSSAALPRRTGPGSNASPVQGGMVSGVASNRRSTHSFVTDAEGKFILSDLEAGDYFVTARRNGLLDTRYGARSGNGTGTRISIAEGQSVTNIRVEMMPQAVIAGKILDEEGEAVQGVQVQLVPPPSTQGRIGQSARAFGGMGRTDDRGEFRVTNVAPGKYLLQVMPMQRGVFAVNDENLAYTSMYFPGVHDASQAEKITVTPGAELSGFQLRLQKTEVYKVQGNVVGPDGQVPAGFFVSLTQKGQMGTSQMAGHQFRRLDDGGFEIRNVTPGSYHLMVRSQGGPPQRGPGGPRGGFVHRETLEVGTQNVENLMVRMAPPFTVTGQVLVEKGAQVDPSNIRVTLFSPDGGGGGQSSVAQQDGTFAFENLSAGRYRIGVGIPQNTAYLESVRFAEQDVLGKDIEITSGGGQLQVKIAANGGTVSGSVSTDGNPSPDTTIVLLPVKKELREQPFLKIVSADQNAGFSISNIAPGDYLVMGIDEYDPEMIHDENQLQILERKAKKISLGKSGSESVVLDLIRTVN